MLLKPYQAVFASVGVICGIIIGILINIFFIAV